MQQQTCGISHRHSIFCILPPHVLREMARRGSTAQRNVALKTLALDATHRSQRLTAQLLAAPPHSAAAASVLRRTVYNSEGREATSGQVARAEGHPAVADKAV